MIVHVAFQKFRQNWQYRSIIHDVVCVSGFVQWYHSGLLPWSRKVRTVDAGLADVDYMRYNYFGTQVKQLTTDAI